MSRIYTALSLHTASMASKLSMTPRRISCDASTGHGCQGLLKNNYLSEVSFQKKTPPFPAQDLVASQSWQPLAKKIHASALPTWTTHFHTCHRLGSGTMELAR